MSSPEGVRGDRQYFGTNEIEAKEARSTIVIGELNQFVYDFTEVEMKVKRVILHPDFFY